MKILQLKDRAIEAYKKPDHPFWSKVGNFCVIVLAPIGTVVIETLVPEPYKKIAQVSWSAVMALIKGATKFTSK
jgi:hypothetical protein